MMERLRKSKQESIVFLFVSILVSFVIYKMFYVHADITPTFIKDVTYTGGLAATTSPAFFGTATGLVTDASGNAYISAGSKIIKISPTGTFLSAFGQLNSAQGLTIDASGNIYVADYGGGGGLKKYDSNGNLMVSTSSSWLEGVALDASGNMYVSVSGYAPLLKYDSSFNRLSDINVSEPLQNWHPGIASDSAGYIYIADWNNAKVKKIDGSGTVLLSFGSTGSSTGQFTNLSGIAVDTAGNIYATDQLNGGRLQKFDSSGNYISNFSIPGNGYPIGVSIDPSNNIWVAAGARVYKFDQSGNILLGLLSGTGPLVGSSTFHPYKVTTDSQGYIYASDDWNGKILKFNPDGDFLMFIGGGYGGNPDQFGWNSDVALDSSGNIYVSDCGTGVKKFAPDGTYLSQIGTGGTGDGQFSCPYSIAFDAQGNLYVSDDSAQNDRIQKFDSSGNFLMKFGSKGNADGQFYWVNGMHIDSAGNLYITDSNNSRVQKFDSNGNFLMKFGTAGTGDGQFSNADGIDVDSQGNIYVSDLTNSNVQKFDASGNFLLSITSSNGLPFSSVGSVHLDNAGKLYVGDYNSGRISIFLVSSPPLVISNISASSSVSTTNITWTTDDLGTTQVEFGPTTEYGSTTPITDVSPRVTSHSVTLSNLAACAVYNFRVISASATATTTSSNNTFTTDDCTGMASSTATTASTASTTATSTVTLSTITVAIPPTFSTTTTATTTFQAVKLEPAAFFASSSVPTPIPVVSMPVIPTPPVLPTTVHVDLPDVRVPRSFLDIISLKVYEGVRGVWCGVRGCQ